MKKLNPVIQFIIGFFSIMLLWGIGALVNTYTVDMWLSENIDTENLLFSEEIYGKIFVQASEGLAKMFLARAKRAQSFLFLCSQRV